ncbi:type I-E CRISPR-associated endoribonuclease Cas2e [Demequina lutea]|uniref:CRISPR-associated protein Cas2 n=1 Tax=Demequina lutea TaxID=431489 RepID=A0A7Y9ZD58_9MICO|nr:type I-E CRISPR-associated endoribonuclease Cas2e [Demequina lutea]NYI42038.1 CRISPR-associated protein Cas2 [Demequina lutea]
MVVIVLTACPAGLRGYLTRWFLEVSPGVFVGRIPARVRDRAWERIIEMIGRGRALLVYSAQGEQGLAFRTYGHDWKPVDFDGIQLIMRRATGDGPSAIPDAPMTPEVGGKSNVAAGWSSTARRRKFARSRSRPG